MTRHFSVQPGVVPEWETMTEPARVVAAFLARVRVTGDVEAARELMAPVVACHQLTSECNETVLRSPDDYAEHVQEMLATFGRFRYTVTDFLADEDRVYVRWRQDGHHLLGEDDELGTGQPLTDLGSAVYRVADQRIAEYWIQLDRLGLQRQVDALVGAQR
jgi:predicted ester cyclase